MPHKNIPKDRLIQVVSPFRIKYKDIFSLVQFYKDFREYLNEHEWKDKEDGVDYWETYYYERIDRNGAKELWIRWRPYKKAPQSTQIGYYLDLDWHCIAVTDTEIVKDGRKMKVNKGELEIYFKAYLDQEYMEGFTSNSALKPFKKIFKQRIFHKQLEQRKKELYQEVYAMQNWMKQWFKLKRYLPYEEYETFWPSKAWPSHLKEE